MPETEATPPPTPQSDSSTWPLIFGTIAALALSFGLAITAVVWANKDNSSTSGSGGAATQVMLSEFKISPSTISVASGGSLSVMNMGTVPHNLSVKGTDLKTPDIPAGSSATLDVSSLAPGSYDVLCLIPGHADSGMKAKLEVTTGGGGTAASGTTATTQMDYKKMTADMLASFAAFPAKTTGVGNQPLKPTEVKADGTKVFDLTMKKAKWEVAPGQVVDAFTFNGIVPGPLMKLAIGDKVEVRVKNELPMATDVHFHGINVDNGNDGVSPLTQKLIAPGKSFTYKFTADEQAVAMYHPHASGVILLPDGMFGAVIVGDVKLPLGRTVGGEQIPANLKISQEIPMVLNDSGTIGLTLNGKSFPATQPYTAKVGDWVLIHYYNEGNSFHPMHLHQFDQVVVAKDGFPLDSPYVADTVAVGPGERYSVLVHLDKPGVWVWHCHILNHAERDTGMFGMVTAWIVK